MKFKKTLALLLVLTLIANTLVGCQSSNNNSTSTSFGKFIKELFLEKDASNDQSNSNITSASDLSEQKEFDKFLDELFVNEVQSDSITLNYTLSDPDRYGIPDFKPTLGAFNTENMLQDMAIGENYLSRLDAFSYQGLSSDQQLTYDILKHTLTQNQQLKDLLLYQEILGPTTGIQAQLPVLLAEYSFYTKEDIDHYIELLPAVYDYFQDISKFQQEKSKEGLFMSDRTADSIIKQCETFISGNEDNYLIDIFNNKISTFPGLSEKEIKKYKKANKEAVVNHVIPAYQLLIDQLNTLKGTGVNNLGLSQFPRGKEYYEYLVHSTSGSSRSILEIKSLLQKSIDSCYQKMSYLIASEPSLIQQSLDVSYPSKDPTNIISYLQVAIEKDFPPLKEVNCTIKYVDKSLEDSLSPAFYLTPALDSYTDNSIYINQSDSYRLDDIFTTLAHEGYPGHLYQNVYFNQQNPTPIRCILNYGGYTEGWATYAEMYSYHMAGLDKNLATLLEANMVVTLDLYAMVDIGVNYEGWTVDDTTKYLSKYGITDLSDIESIYYAMIEEPANYMKYTLGYLEIKELEHIATSSLGKNYSPTNFHKFILETGPAPFSVLNDRLKQWIRDQK